MALHSDLTNEQLGVLHALVREIEDRINRTLSYDQVVTTLKRVRNGQLDCRLSIGENRFVGGKMVIHLGYGLRTADDFRESLRADDRLFDEGADALVGSHGFMTCQEENETTLAAVTTAQLGFKVGSTLEQAFQRAASLGYRVLISEVGPRLCEQYKGQPPGERVIVATKPIQGLKGELRLFAVEKQATGGQWLTTVNGNPDYMYGPDTIWVFGAPLPGAS